MSRNQSLCERLCQFPNYLHGNDIRFANEPGESLARLNTGGTFGEIGESGNGGVSPLKKRRLEEEDVFKRFLVVENTDQTINDDGKVLIEQEEQEGIGEICMICNINPGTHFAVPCKHKACSQCWGRWLSVKDQCMVCAVKIERIQRFPKHILPLAPYEITFDKDEIKDINGCIVEVEENLDQSLRAILQVKDILSNLVGNFQQTETHLVNMTRPEPGRVLSLETLTSVLAVEHSSVVEQLGKYQNLLSNEWESMDQELDGLLVSIKKLGIKSQQETDHEFAKEICSSVASPNSISGQWGRLQGLLEQLSNHMPKIVRVFSMVGQVPNVQPVDIPFKSQTVMSIASGKRQATGVIITKLVNQTNEVLKQLN